MKSKYLSTWMQRAAVMALLMVSSISYALASKVYIEDFSIKAGAEKNIAVCFDTEISSYTTFGVQITLPEGLSFVTEAGPLGDQIKITPTDRVSAMSVYGSPKTGKISITGDIAAGTGTLFTIRVKADAKLAESSEITVSGVELLKTVDGDAIITGNAKVTKEAEGMVIAFSESVLNIEAGATKSVAVTLNNGTSKVNAFQADVVLPEGFTYEFVGGRIATNEAKVDNRIMSTASISGTSGALFSLKITAPKDFTGSAAVMLTNISATVGMSDTALDNISLTVNAGGSEGGVPQISFAKSTLSIGASMQGTVDVNMENAGIAVQAFQADVDLPTGWQFEFVGGRIATNKGKNKRIMTTTAISGESGALFSLNLIAPADFEGEATVKLTNIIATVALKDVELADITLTVKSQDEAAKAAADAITDELVKQLAEAQEVVYKVAPNTASVFAPLIENLAMAIKDLKQQVEDEYAKIGTVDLNTLKKNAYTITKKIEELEPAAKTYEETWVTFDNSIKASETAVAALAVSEEAKASNNASVAAAVKLAEEAIEAAKKAVAEERALFNQGNLIENLTQLQAAEVVTQSSINTAKNEIADADGVLELAADEEALAELKISDEARAYDNEEVKAAVKAADEAIEAAKAAVAALKAVVDAGNLFDNAEKFAKADEAADLAILEASALVTVAEATYLAAEEAAAQAAENAKVQELEKIVDNLAVSEEAKASNNAEVAAAVKVAEDAIEAAKLAAMKYAAKVAEGNILLNKEEIDALYENASVAIANAVVAISTAEAIYKKSLDDEADEAVKALATNRYNELRDIMSTLGVSYEAAVCQHPDVVSAVTEARLAMHEADLTLDTLWETIQKGKLATDNADELIENLTAANEAVAAAQAAVKHADEVYKNVTAINGITVDKLQNAEIYNMQGVKVDKSRLSKGLYIINGKKVVIK